MSLVEDDIELITRLMSDMWLDPALEIVECDKKGMGDNDAIFSIQQAKEYVNGNYAAQ